MDKGRLEAFSDGVIAIIITIMVLELRAPQSSNLAALRPLHPVFLSYLVSFIYVGIHWKNHHHLLQSARMVSGATLWANMHLLFWLSLIPFTTSWHNENPGHSGPVALYGAVLLMAAIAFAILAHTLARIHGKDSLLADALGRKLKGVASILLYLVAIPLAFFFAAWACAIYVLVAVIWLIPVRLESPPPTPEPPRLHTTAGPLQRERPFQ